MMFLSFGRGTRCHTLCLVNSFNSSCMARIHSGSASASEIYLGSICEINAELPNSKFICCLVLTGAVGLPITDSAGWFFFHFKFGPSMLSVRPTDSPVSVSAIRLGPASVFRLFKLLADITFEPSVCRIVCEYSLISIMSSLSSSIFNLSVCFMSLFISVF